jgi:Glycosyl hydrolases family 43/Carbohydrate binding module (family 6)
MKNKNILSGLLVLSFQWIIQVSAQNPVIRDQYSADPSARVFNNKVYLFPSHDILANPGKGRVGWFCMEDYHVFSSENLTDWKDHGMIVTQNKVPWVRPDSYSMWAPDCIEREGKYYFYFPSFPKDTVVYGRGFAIGVAIAEQPEGPYIPESTPIAGVKGIDPNVFIDKDGQAYLYWSQRNIYAAKLKKNMRELDSEVYTLRNLPDSGLKEGPYMFERNGIYYLTYPHVENKTERLEYAVSDNPVGPFKVTGVIMKETAGCWTNHHSIIQFRNQWYLFYHANDYSPGFDKARSVRIDSLFFRPDGTIEQVIPTWRGVGITRASDEIQIDRYSARSQEGITISFNDTTNRFMGWKIIFDQPGAWVQYNNVDAGANKSKSILAKVKSTTGGKLQVRSGGPEGLVLAELDITPSDNWQYIKSELRGMKKGIFHLVVTLKGNQPVELDWIRFE